MTAVSWYSSSHQVECKFSIGIPKGKVFALKCSKIQIPKIHLIRPGNVLTVNSGHYKLETMLEPNKAFILAKIIFCPRLPNDQSVSIHVFKVDFSTQQFFQH